MAPGRRRGRGGSSGASEAKAAAQQWNFGDLVLAKMKGFTAWPAQVANPLQYKQKASTTRVFVAFFGTGQIGFCHPSEVSVFNAEKAKDSARKVTSPNFRKAIGEICEAAEIKASGKLPSDYIFVKRREYTEMVERTENGMPHSEDGNVGSGDDQDVDSNARAGGSATMVNRALEDADVDVGCSDDVDSSPMDRSPEVCVGNAAKGIVLPGKVQTNFASHEELDDFSLFCEESTPAQTEIKTKIAAAEVAAAAAAAVQKPARQAKQPASRRSSKPKKSDVTVPTSVPRKRRQPTSRANKRDEEVHEEAAGGEPSSSPRKRPRTPRCDVLEAGKPQQEPSFAHEPDDHLPILKRARARHELVALPPKLRSRNTIVDSEAGLPPSKRRFRAMEAMAQVMENTEADEESLATRNNVAPQEHVPEEGEVREDPPIEVPEGHQQRQSEVEEPVAAAAVAAVDTSSGILKVKEEPSTIVKQEPDTSVPDVVLPLPSTANVVRPSVAREEIRTPVEDAPPARPDSPVTLGRDEASEMEEGELPEVDSVRIREPSSEPVRNDVASTSNRVVESRFMRNTKVTTTERVEFPPKVSRRLEDAVETRPSRYSRRHTEYVRQSSPRGVTTASVVVRQSSSTKVETTVTASPKVITPPARTTKVVSPPARTAEVISPPTRRSEVISPSARRSEVISPPARRSEAENSASPAAARNNAHFAANGVRGGVREERKRKRTSTPSPGAKDSNSGESLASENDRTPARSKLRPQSSGDLKHEADARMQTVNKVRAAYEAAKLAKQEQSKYLDMAIAKHGAFASPPVRQGSLEDDTTVPPGFATSDEERQRKDAMNALNGMLDTLSRSKESINGAARQAMECAKLGLKKQVIDNIARRLEVQADIGRRLEMQQPEPPKEMDDCLNRRVDLFYVVDSIAQHSHSIAQHSHSRNLEHKHDYKPVIAVALPRLLQAAAPGGIRAHENRNLCYKVLRAWQDKEMFPVTTTKHFCDQINKHNNNQLIVPRRPPRNERPVDDPIREMEGMHVDEYGSNATILPGLQLQLDDDDDAENGYTGDGVPGQEVTTPHGERQPRVLEEVDKEVEMEDEMEDVSPVSEPGQWSRSPASILATGPPLPECPPPTPPPLPSSPPPSTPPAPSSPRAQPGYSPGQYNQGRSGNVNGNGRRSSVPSHRRTNANRRRVDRVSHRSGWDDMGYHPPGYGGYQGPPYCEYDRGDYGYPPYGPMDGSGPPRRWDSPPGRMRDRDRPYRPPPPPPPPGFYEDDGYDRRPYAQEPPPPHEGPPYNVYDYPGRYDHGAYPEYYHGGEGWGRGDRGGPPYDYYPPNGPPQPYVQRHYEGGGDGYGRGYSPERRGRSYSRGGASYSVR